MAKLDFRSIREAQQRWEMTPVASRVVILRALRNDMAEGARELAGTVPLELPGQLHRSIADTLCSEVLPLAEACRFLEREAAALLAPVRQPSRLRPVWLGGVSIETRREALGIVLIIGPGNYPLFLPGAQTLQALAAGNAVVWKPAPGGKNAAFALRTLLASNGLDPQLLTIIDQSPEAAQAAIEAGVDKVIFTGSADTGRAVLHSLADKLTPSVMELSGCDAVFVLEGEDLETVVEALMFGLRLNGSATCMAPRRVILSESLAAQLIPQLANAMRGLAPVPVPQATRERLSELIYESELLGGQITVNGLNGNFDRQNENRPNEIGATLIVGGSPSMRIAQADIFAPVLTILHANSDEEALAIHRECPYALTAAVFGPRRKAEAFAARVHAGTVLVNDLIVASADPRASFGGLGSSGFGTTRGATGLLEMTAVKNVIVLRGRSRRAWQPTSSEHADLLASLLRTVHGKGWLSRLGALRDLIKSARNLRS